MITRTLALLLVALLGLAGCGSEVASPASEALSSRLEAVDVAATANDPEELEVAVESLLQEVELAEDAGDLTAEQSDRIRAAARALLEAAAPTAPPDREPAPPGPSSSATPPSEEEDPDDDSDDEDDDESAATGGEPDPGKSTGKNKSKDRDD